MIEQVIAYLCLGKKKKAEDILKYMPELRKNIKKLEIEMCVDDVINGNITQIEFKKSVHRIIGFNSELSKKINITYKSFMYNNLNKIPLQITIESDVFSLLQRLKNEGGNKSDFINCCIKKVLNDDIKVNILEPDIKKIISWYKYISSGSVVINITDPTIIVDSKVKPSKSVKKTEKKK